MSKSYMRVRSSYKQIKIIYLTMMLGFVLSPSFALAEIVSYRWTAKESSKAGLADILSILNQKTQLQLTENDFRKYEERDLAFNHFVTYQQLLATVPIHSAVIRVWSDIQTGGLLQAEIDVENGVSTPSHPSPFAAFAVVNGVPVVTQSHIQRVKGLKQLSSLQLARAAIKRSGVDTSVRAITTNDRWLGTDLQRVVEAKGKHGTHVVVISLSKQRLVSYEYREFPMFDMAASVYPIYEEVESTGSLLKRTPVMLKHLNEQVRASTSDIYLPLRSQHYYEDMWDEDKAQTPEGQALGYWSLKSIKANAEILKKALPTRNNDIASGGILLDGLYTTINLHPDVITKFPGIAFTPNFSSQLIMAWKLIQRNGTEMAEYFPASALLGRPMLSMTEALSRPARRLPNHDPAEYINDGFDEVQVYYGVTQLMESLQNMGFTDPELATRPFHAFLYDPDISMKNNAYYDSDTINFTTYSGEAPNLARDNTTIWHELGHGVMDRLMGNLLNLADTGGLSEGMADFIATLVIQDVTKGAQVEGLNELRINNGIGFYLTNEVHDDGEAYGGSMKDFMDLAIQQFGQQGLAKVVDLTLETMRLCRNHPHLTAQDWFSHMLFADELGRAGVRAPGELGPLLHQALDRRNFTFTGIDTASMEFKNGGNEVVSGSPGARSKPIQVSLASNEEASYNLSVQLHSSSTYAFTYPVRVEVGYQGGPLQGSVKWKNESATPDVYVLNNPQDKANFVVTALGTCDGVNREDGSCADYVYVKVYDSGGKRPVAKKRFYVQVKPQ